MNKKGFTLIELFAVIIVLALLALITTPAIMDSIDNSKMNGALRSADQLIKAIVLDYTTNDNFTTDELDVLSFNYDGDKPEFGYIQFNENEKARLYMVYNGYCVTKRFDSELTAVKIDNEDICDWYTSDKTIREETNDSLFTINDLAENNLLNYKIYGNSTQATRSGKNLLDIRQVKLNQYVNAGGVSSTANFANKNGCVAFIIAVEPNTTYTLSSSSLLRRRVSEIDGVDTKVIVKDLVTLTGGEMPYTFTTSATTNGLMVTLQIGSNPTDVITEEMVKNAYIQVEKGATATTYEEYGVMPSPEFPSEVQSLGTLVSDLNSSNYGKYEIDIKVTNEDLSATKEHSIYLDEPLRCIGDSCDYIDYENSMVVRKVGVQKLLSTSNIAIFKGSTTTDTELYRYYFKPSPTMKSAATGKGNGYSTVGYKAKETYNKWTTPYQLYFGLSNQHISVVTDVEISNYQDFYNYLSNNGNSDVIFYFELEQSYDTKISGLPKIKTFDGTNNITVSDGNLFASKIELIAIKK